ncbi:NUDIX domain-containing protein [Patescibacteria group bacterium]|nr:NUDIX domain-containing protein [Patescibacteria group bacterium]MBU4580550.1 NUDIX domain-containing protein [Patescibacteria group bacterium]
MKKLNNQLPLNAKRAFKGEIFEVWQWEQKMFDGSVEIFEKLKRSNTAGVIAAAGGKILIQAQEQPDKPEVFASIPGGRCEEGEDSLVAAKRELLEETGYASDDWELWNEQEPVSKLIWTVYTYIARDCVYKQPPRLDAGEKITIRFISFDEFLMLSEDKNFYEKELVNALYRARFDKKFREEFRKLLFKK